MTDSMPDAIVIAARAYRKAEKDLWARKRYQKGPGGCKVTGQMVKDSRDAVRETRMTLDRLLDQHDEGRPLFGTEKGGA